jgi:hypothetical protein
MISQKQKTYKSKRKKIKGILHTWYLRHPAEARLAEEFALGR